MSERSYHADWHQRNKARRNPGIHARNVAAVGRTRTWLQGRLHELGGCQGNLDATAAERAMLRHWRSAGIEPVPGVPADRRTETAPIQHLQQALAFLTGSLGRPTALAAAA